MTPLYTARICYEDGDQREECVVCREPIADRDTIHRYADERASHASCPR
jgi:hypothetical protein